MKKKSKILIRFIGIFVLISLMALQTNKKSERDDVSMNLSIEKATFGAGCFWCVEAVYESVKGIIRVESGYAGGHVKNPSYEEVCRGNTGHAEVAMIYFDPSLISFEELCQVFWHSHNPTTLNRQGNDVGSQYRSVIFYHNQIQKEDAFRSKESIIKSSLWKDPIVTEILPIDTFYLAENYHQNYYANNSQQAYCSYVIAPKLEKFKKEFKHLLKTN